MKLYSSQSIITIAILGLIAASALTLGGCGKFGIGVPKEATAPSEKFSSIEIQTFEPENMTLSTNAFIVWKQGVTSEQQRAFSKEAGKFEKAINISLSSIALKQQAAKLKEDATPFAIKEGEFKARGEALQTRKLEIGARQQGLVERKTKLDQDKTQLESDATQLASDQLRLQDPALTPEAREALKLEITARAADLENRKNELTSRGTQLVQDSTQLQADGAKLQSDGAQLQTEVAQFKADPALAAVQARKAKLEKEGARLQGDAKDAMVEGSPIDPAGDVAKTGQKIIQHKYSVMAPYVTHFAHPTKILINFDRSKTNPDVTVVGWTFSPAEDGKLLELMTTPAPKKKDPKDETKDEKEAREKFEQLEESLTLSSISREGKPAAIVNTKYTSLGGKLEFEVLGPSGRYIVKAERNDYSRKWFFEKRLTEDGPALERKISEMLGSNAALDPVATRVDLIDEIRAIQVRIADATNRGDSASIAADSTILSAKSQALQPVSDLAGIKATIAEMNANYSFYGSGMKFIGNDGFEANGTVRRMVGKKAEKK
jgi:hypothetical protein